MKKELTEQKGEQYSFQAHSELLKDYMTKVVLEKRRWKKKRVVRKDTVDFCRNWIPIRKKRTKRNEKSFNMKISFMK